MDIVEQLPDGEKELYFAQQMGLDLEAIPVNVDAALLSIASSMPQKAPRQWGKTLRPFQSLDALGYDEDGNIIHGSAPMVYKRSEKGRKQWKTTEDTKTSCVTLKAITQAKIFRMTTVVCSLTSIALKTVALMRNNLTQRTLAYFVDKEVISIRTIEYQAEDSQGRDAIDRGTAVKQQNINRGYMQNLQSPTLRPMMMKQSLDQTDNLREKAQIAVAHGDPTLAAMFMQMDADDTALLMAEVEGRANAEPEEFNPEQPGAVSNMQINQLRSGQQNTTGLATELAATGNMTAEEASDYAAKQGVRALKDRMPVKMILADPQVMSSLDRKLDSLIYGLMDEVPDAMRGTEFYKPYKPIPMIRDDFIRDAMTTYGFAPGSEAALGDYFDVFHKRKI